MQQETYQGIPVMSKEELDRAARGETCLCGGAVFGQCAYCKAHVCKDEYFNGYCIDCYANLFNPLGEEVYL